MEESLRPREPPPGKVSKTVSRNPTRMPRTSLLRKRGKETMFQEIPKRRTTNDYEVSYQLLFKSNIKADDP